MDTRKTEAESNQVGYDKFSNEFAQLGLKSTKWLVHRDLPFILAEHLFARNPKSQYKVLDFGCGAGQTLKFLSGIFKEKNYQVQLVGIDINKENIVKSKLLNPEADLVAVEKNVMPSHLKDFDLIICNFVLLENEYPDLVKILKNIHEMLCDKGIAIISGNTGKAYDKQFDWVSWNTNFPENERQLVDAKSDKLKRVDGQRVVKQMYGLSFSFFDHYYARQTYKKAFHEADLKLMATRKPLGQSSDGIEWKSELHTAPYRMDIICKDQSKVMSQPNPSVKPR